MIYGTDVLGSPEAYQEIKDFFGDLNKEKLRFHHGVGTPIEVLNGVMAGIDVFESDYPLGLAEKGISLQIESIDKLELIRSKQNPAKAFLQLSKEL